MIFVGQVHLPAQFTIPVLLLIAAAILWYWVRLGRENVPRSRRRIRRLSTGLMLIALPVLGKALSFVDPALDSQSSDYVMTWTVVLLFVVAVVVTAAIDVINSVRLHHAAQLVEMHEAAANLRDALDRHQRRKRETAAPEQPGGSRVPSTGNDRL
jgi:cytochrome c oxidase assembly factor CtaG